MTATPVPDPAGLDQWHVLERSISLTGRQRLRCLWYRLRLTVQEMNYATSRLVELQAPGQLTTADRKGTATTANKRHPDERIQ